MTVIGVDADRRRLAVAVLSDGKRWRKSIERTDSAGRFVATYREQVGAMMAYAARQGAVVFLEGIYLPPQGDMRRNVDTFRVLANVQGEPVYEAHFAGVDLRLVQPTQWQSAVLGFARDRGRIKAASSEVAGRLFGPGLSEHESDAACLCIYGRLMLENAAA